MNTKKTYIKPMVTRIELDNSISLVMMSNNGNGNGHGHGNDKPKPPHPHDDTFASPFQSPFN